MAGTVTVPDEKKKKPGKGAKKAASSASNTSSAKSAAKKSLKKKASIKSTVKKSVVKKTAAKKKPAVKNSTKKVTMRPEVEPKARELVPEESISAQELQEYSSYSTFMEESDESDQELVEFLTFTLTDKHYAFRIKEVEEILQVKKATYVPRTKDFVVGIITVRGKIVPVIDIAGIILDGESPDYSMRGKIVILKSVSGSVGVRMNRNLNIVLVPEESVQPAPGHLDESDRKFISGVIKVQDNFVSVLNTETLLSVQAARGTHEGEA